MHNQKRMFVVVMAAIVVLGCAVAVAGTDPMQGVALKQTINLTMPTVVGGTLLPQGEYKVNHEMQGTEHIMIFTKVGGKAEAKAKCNLVPLNAKAKTTEHYCTIVCSIKYGSVSVRKYFVHTGKLGNTFLEYMNTNKRNRKSHHFYDLDEKDGGNIFLQSNPLLTNNYFLSKLIVIRFYQHIIHS